MDNKNIIFEHSVNLSIPFYDTDAMQVVWHGNYLKYFEIARDGLFREKGIDLYSFFDTHQYLFPIIRSSVKFISPLRFRDEITCTAFLKDVRRKIIMDFTIRRVPGRELCATGTTEQAAVSFKGEGMELEIPRELRFALGCRK